MQNQYLLATIGADTAENEWKFVNFENESQNSQPVRSPRAARRGEHDPSAAEAAADAARCHLLEEVLHLHGVVDGALPADALDLAGSRLARRLGAPPEGSVCVVCQPSDGTGQALLVVFRDSLPTKKRSADISQWASQIF